MAPYDVASIIRKSLPRSSLAMTAASVSYRLSCGSRASTPRDAEDRSTNLTRGAFFRARNFATNT